MSDSPDPNTDKPSTTVLDLPEEPKPAPSPPPKFVDDSGTTLTGTLATPKESNFFDAFKGLVEVVHSMIKTAESGLHPPGAKPADLLHKMNTQVIPHLQIGDK